MCLYVCVSVSVSVFVFADVYVCVFMCVCSSCDMSSTSVQKMEAAENVGKLTEVDKAHTGRVGPSFHHYEKCLYQYY